MQYLKHMKTKRTQRVLCLLSICILIGMALPDLHGQSLSSADLTTINVDDLSDDQLINYMKQAESSGYTQAQLEAFARQRGMSETQIAKLRTRISQLSLNTGQSANDLKISSNNRDDFQLTVDNIFGNLAGEGNIEGLTEEQSKIFGYDLFRSDKLNFSPNLNIPTPAGYILGPGDGIVIDLWGDTQQYWTLEVSPEGTVRPQDLSPIYVNGLTIEMAREKLVNRLSQAYGGLKPSDGSKPTIFHQISLGNIRSINVTIVGEVHSPGNYALNSLSTVFTALYAAGGPSEEGTFRSIRLMRDNKLKAEVDVYDFLVDGIKPNDELLRDGDVIIVKLNQGQVTVEGEARRPGFYELKKGETFEDLIENFGGFNSNAFKSFILVDRFSDSGKKILNISASNFGTEYPEDGDVVSIRLNQEVYSNRVVLEGAVQMEGAFELSTGLTVKGVIEKSGGLKGDAYVERATIYRMRKDFSQETLSFNLREVLAGEQPDIQLMSEDVVRVSSIYDLREEYYVEIAGEVALAGTYPYIDRMTVEDLVLLAGGLTDGASGARVEISRRNTGGLPNSLSEIITLEINKDLSMSNAKQEVEIEPFDQIFIRKKPNYNLQQQVTVEGEVSSPGIYVISRKDERISDIVNRAGGLTSYAYPDGAVLIRKTEFASKQSDYDLNLEKLKLLQMKILGDTAQTMNEARLQLYDRLDVLIIKTQKDKEEAEDKEQQLINLEPNSAADSLLARVRLNEEEPTVLDLNQILNNPGSKYDLIVKEGDLITIPGKLETVRVAGEVISALNLRYDETFSFKDYINDAGGFASTARKGRSYVQYPNGRRKQARRFLFFKFYPRVEPGSTIIVTRKPDRDKVSLQEILAITSSLATITFLVDRIRN